VPYALFSVNSVLSMHSVLNFPSRPIRAHQHD